MNSLFVVMYVISKLYTSTTAILDALAFLFYLFIL